MKKWEYKYVYIALRRKNEEDELNKDLEKNLNDYGKAGWELVSITPHILNDETIDGFAIFKREKIEKEPILFSLGEATFIYAMTRLSREKEAKKYEQWKQKPISEFKEKPAFLTACEKMEKLVNENTVSNENVI